MRSSPLPQLKPLRNKLASAKRQHGFLSSATEGEVNKFFEGSTFKEAVLAPMESYRGVVFFSQPPQKGLVDRWFRKMSVYNEGGPKVRLGVTNLDSGDRMLFGPFTVTLPEN